MNTQNREGLPCTGVCTYVVHDTYLSLDTLFPSPKRVCPDNLCYIQSLTRTTFCPDNGIPEVLHE